MDAAGQGQRIRQFWDGYAADYDAEPDHGLRRPDMRLAWRDVLARLLPPAPSVVADLGCGTGSLTEVVASLGHRVWALDCSTEMLRRAGAKVARFGDQVSVHLGDAADPPLEPGSVDTVLARHVVWTLPDPGAALSRWVSLVRPGGQIVLIEGRWQAHPTESYVGGPALPWDGGVSATDLRATLLAIDGESGSGAGNGAGPAHGVRVTEVDVLPLTEERLWGRTVGDERYALVATVSGVSRSRS